MNKPNFICGPYNIEIEHPEDWSIKRLVSEDSSDTISGQTLTDTVSRKYEYLLGYNAMTNSDYGNLEELLDYAEDNNLAITFVYNKFPQLATSRQCKVKLSDVAFTAGPGNTFFYVKLNITIREISKRS